MGNLRLRGHHQPRLGRRSPRADSYTINRLTPGVEYAFIVASNYSRYGVPSWPDTSGWSFLALQDDPSPESTVGTASVDLEWDPTPDAQFYRIGWVVHEDVVPIIAAGGEWLDHFVSIDIANRGQIEHTVTRLTPGLRYAFIVAGNDGRYDEPRWPAATAWQFITPVAGPTHTDRAALVAFYHVTSGQYWDEDNNWLSYLPIGEWYGVSTDDDDRVTALNLSRNRLRGEIPAELANLTNLRELDLRDNRLEGQIPVELARLTNLERLVLRENELVGELPVELGNLASLRELDLFINRLTGRSRGNWATSPIFTSWTSATTS